MKLSLVCRIL